MNFDDLDTESLIRLVESAGLAPYVQQALHGRVLDVDDPQSDDWKRHLRGYSFIQPVVIAVLKAYDFGVTIGAHIRADS